MLHPSPIHTQKNVTEKWKKSKVSQHIKVQNTKNIADKILFATVIELVFPGTVWQSESKISKVWREWLLKLVLIRLVTQTSDVLTVAYLTY